MNRAEYAYSQARTYSQPLPDTDRVNHPIWSLEMLDETGDEADMTSVDMTSEELIVGWSLLQMYGQWMSTSGEPVAVMPKKTLPERLALMLLDLSAEQDGLIEDVTFHDLAVALDTNRDTIASILRAFRRQGLVDFGHRRMLIQDVGSLAEIAGEPDIRFI